MTKTSTPAKPCSIRVTARLYDWTDVRWARGFHASHTDKPIVYRSIREARRNIVDAAGCMDRLSRASYEIDIVTVDGKTIPVRDSIVDHVEEWNRRESYEHSIGQRIYRGEAVAC